ncbi:truncated GAF-domain protein (fragment 2) [Staphylococcus carnosus subsp. carnosus TM300]|uniref:Truncated GAF-domain protein (Fragment 2) n=1 Tax=Staphylococcus carnosus (strain TM300) TaxID=396513 RepID=B9DN90_STACT|nr:truncated GAF-domain protein (fragment 2) [Staphylococcus carnosus subsp. carnosus TM300]
MHRNGEVIGLLDIDAPIKERFTGDDQVGLESIMKILEKQIAQTVK